jgi:hypothetical protein
MPGSMWERADGKAVYGDFWSGQEKRAACFAGAVGSLLWVLIWLKIPQTYPGLGYPPVERWMRGGCQLAPGRYASTDPRPVYCYEQLDGFALLVVCLAVPIALWILWQWTQDWRAYRVWTAKDRLVAQYARAAVRHAEFCAVAAPYLHTGCMYEGRIPGIDGVTAEGVSRDICRHNLEQAVVKWVDERQADGEPLPIVDGIELGIRQPGTPVDRL